MFSPTTEWVKEYQQQMLDTAENEKRAKNARPRQNRTPRTPFQDENIIILSLGAGAHPIRSTKSHTTL